MVMATSYDILAGSVDHVVEVQLHRPGLGVVAGHAQVIVIERAGGEEPGAQRGNRDLAAR